MNITRNDNVDFSTVFDVVLADSPSRSREIIAKRFGIGEKVPMTLQAIGNEYGITRERVRQIVQTGLRNTCNINDCEQHDKAKNIIISYIQDNHNVVEYTKIETALGGEDNDEIGAIRFLIEGSFYDKEDFHEQPYQNT